MSENKFTPPEAFPKAIMPEVRANRTDQLNTAVGILLRRMPDHTQEEVNILKFVVNQSIL